MDTADPAGRTGNTRPTASAGPSLLRGGAWTGDWSNLGAFASNYDSPTREIDNIGFRLASVPEPSAGSAGLLALAGLGGLALRSHRRG